MEIVIYILAVIGGLTVLIGLLLAVMMFCAVSARKEQSDKPDKIMCGLTMGDCIYGEKEREENCDGCPIAEEAEKIGNR